MRAWKETTPVELRYMAPTQWALYDANIEAWETYVDIQTESAKASSHSG